MESGDFPSSSPADKTAPRASQNQRTKKNKSAKRFSDEQIRSLETMFKLETKLEPKKKLQLARELALQPRQVAIWFQNRRARWKSKKLEQEYKVLKANYDNLNAQYESLKEEKHSLHIQLQKLNDLLEEPHSTSYISKVLKGKSLHRGFVNENAQSGQVKTNASSVSTNHKLESRLIMQSDDKQIGTTTTTTGYLPHEYEELELLSLCEQLDGSSAPIEKWSNFDSSGISTHLYGNSTNWWEF